MPQPSLLSDFRVPIAQVQGKRSQDGSRTLSLVTGRCSCAYEAFQTRCPPSSPQHWQNIFLMLCLLEYDFVKLLECL